MGLLGRDPFNQNFRAEVRKVLGGKWIATGPEGLVPFHSQKEFRALLKCRMLINERSISIGPVQPSKVVHHVRLTRFLKLFRLDRADPFSFRPKFPEILVEWIAPLVSKKSFLYLLSIKQLI